MIEMVLVERHGVNINNNTVISIRSSKRLDLNHSHHKKGNDNYMT